MGSTTHDHKCKITDASLRCSVQSGRKVWQSVGKGDASIAATVCPDNSIPWRSQIVCDHEAGKGIQGPVCFTTHLQGYGSSGAVCVTAGKDTPMHPTNSAIRDLRNIQPISHDKRVDVAEIEKNLTPCYVQPFKEMGPHAMMISYVGKGESEKCRFMREDAVDACRHSGRATDECERKVRHIYADEREKSYECTLDTRKLPLAHEHDGREWWRWIRHNRYSCRDPGWWCEDTKLAEYAGGATCEKDEQCNDIIESGVCNMESGSCAIGSAKGTRCTTHEQCDHIGPANGLCKNGKCQKGRVGTDATYYAPKECSVISSQKHTFCGKMKTAQGERFAGVCMPYDYDGKTFYGCKAFDSTAEIEKIMADETDWQAQTRSQNFRALQADWEKLELCPDEDKYSIDGRSVCQHTTQPLPLRGSVVKSLNDKDAHQKCQDRRCTQACTPGMCYRDRTEGGRCKAIEGRAIAVARNITQPSLS